MATIKRFISLIFLLLALSVPLSLQAQDSNEVIILEATGPVTPAMTGYFERGIATAEEDGASAIVLVLDTPGGAVDATLEIVQAFRASAVPIIVFVSPRGAQAASAGSIITMAGHASAMSPETVIGAASPVGENGVDLEETIFRKISEDLKATVRNLTADRGQEATDLAEAMIEDARAVTADEALEAGLIDVVATDVPDLLQQLDGLPVIVQEEPVTLSTANSTQRELPMSAIEQVLFALVSPVLLGLLLTIGVQAIFIELSNPGGWVAGLIGVLCIGLALYGIGQLPVNWLGVGLIVLAFVLFLMEANTPTYGALALTGTALLIAGLLVLFNSPGTPDFATISIPAAITIGLLTATLFLFILSKVLGARRSQPATGSEGLIGRTGPVRKPLDSADHEAPFVGTVMVAGELWRAQAEQEIDKGSEVIVIGVDGLTLQVASVD